MNRWAVQACLLPASYCNSLTLNHQGMTPRKYVLDVTYATLVSLRSLGIKVHIELDLECKLHFPCARNLGCDEYIELTYQ